MAQLGQRAAQNLLASRSLGPASNYYIQHIICATAILITATKIEIQLVDMHIDAHVRYETPSRCKQASMVCTAKSRL